MKKKLFIWLQYGLPQHFVSWCAGRLAECRWRWFKALFIGCFARRYAVNMQEAERQQLSEYDSFNDFFTRSLKAGARNFDSLGSEIICPVDGGISAIGKVEGDAVFQAKGHSFTLNQLLACEQNQSDAYRHGLFATLYLSPKDYHRVHLPYAGKLLSMTYVPGSLFSVNDWSVEAIPRLFARNERMVCHFETDLGAMAVVMVGAMIVGSMQTVWSDGPIKLSSKGQLKHWDLQHRNIMLNKGDEMGRFLLGSTAIVLFANPQLAWDEKFKLQREIRLGQTMITPS